MNNKIYAYYESIGTRKQAEEFARANVWKHTWKLQGWEPIMLNGSHSKGSPLFQKLIAKLLTVSRSLSASDQNDIQRIFVRFNRWAAIHAAGGGWFSDYDVINDGFTPKDAESLLKNRSLVLIGEENPFCIYANANICQGAIQKFISNELQEDQKIKTENEVLNQPNESVATLIHFKSDGKKQKSELMNEFFQKKSLDMVI
jgi:hypothetical protein